jgi:hypothetical protein
MIMEDKKMNRIIVIFLFLATMGLIIIEPVYSETKTLPYKVLKKESMGSVKASYDIQVDLVKENGKKRLPNEAELKAVSEEIKAKEKNTQKVFVLFYLPGMKLDEGAFAKAHHDPDLSVQIMEYMLFGTNYEKFIKKK